MRKYFSVLLFVLLVVLIIGFVRRNYYRNIKSPLHTELELAASFGEIRPDHFHMGLDIRTNGKENLPVYAVEDGFISLVKIEPYGYGKAVFLQQDDGKTSVYAHLNRFTDVVEKLVKERQYATQSWQQDITCSVAVKKGELIGYSGNTGRSEGPHLHFELRDTRTGNNLNPSLFGYTVTDNTAPLIEGLYWYDRRYSTYEQGPAVINLDNKKGAYRTKRKVVKVGSPLVSLGIRTEDRVDGSRFRYGIYRSQVWLDDRLIYDYTLNNFSDSDSRYVNACFDYSYRINSGLTVQHLSKLPGNRLPVFTGGDGLIRLNDTLPHRVRIVISDVSYNTADLDFIIQRGHFDRYLKDVSLLEPGMGHVVKSKNAAVLFFYPLFHSSVVNHKNGNEAVPLLLDSGQIVISRMLSRQDASNSIALAEALLAVVKDRAALKLSEDDEEIIEFLHAVAESINDLRVELHGNGKEDVYTFNSNNALLDGFELTVEY